MSRRPRRNHSAAFKAKVAIEALADGKTIAEIAQKHDVHPNQVTEWRRQLLERAAGVFGAAVTAQEPAVDLKALHAKIGQLTLENDFLEGALTKAGLLSAKRGSIVMPICRSSARPICWASAVARCTTTPSRSPRPSWR
jgi:transposase